MYSLRRNAQSLCRCIDPRSWQTYRRHSAHGYDTMAWIMKSISTISPDSRPGRYAFPAGSPHARVHVWLDRRGSGPLPWLPCVLFLWPAC